MKTFKGMYKSIRYEVEASSVYDAQCKIFDIVKKKNRFAKQYDIHGIHANEEKHTKI